MKKAPFKVANSTTCAALIGFCLIVTFIMFAINFNQYVISYQMFKSILITCGVISSLSYLCFVYLKIRYWDKSSSKIATTMIKLLFLGIALYITISFPLAVLSR
jgi:hypothetical protein